MQDTPSMQRADASAPNPPAERQQLFTAATPQGTLHLLLPARHGADAVGAALALADAEPLLAALEVWLAISLDPVPQPGAGDGNGSGSDNEAAGLVWCSAPGNVRLGMPWPLLAQASPWDTSGLPVLHSPVLELQVVLARWPVLPPAPDASTGGLLLLPASFDGSWRVSLVQAELGFEIDAHWPGPGHPPTLAGAPRRAVAQAASVRLVQTLHWPLQALLGWVQPPDAPLADPAQAFGATAAPAACSGRIVPALGGFGLLVPGAAGAPAAVACGTFAEPVPAPVFAPVSAVVPAFVLP